MTIEFNCPKCDSLIAFPDKHAGRTARCLSCQQRLVIPQESFQKPQLIETPPDPASLIPQPGFYRAVFIDTWKIFAESTNAATLAFIIAAVCFKFFLGRGPCCIGFISHFVIWGWLFGLYLNIIYETAFDEDILPQIYLGDSITFLWHIFGPIVKFVFTMLVVQLPFIISLAVLQDKGITYENLLQRGFGIHNLLQFFFIAGVFVFPMAILTIAVGQSLELLRPDRLFHPMLKAPIPYIVTVLLLLLFSMVEIKAVPFNLQPAGKAAMLLAFNLFVQLVAIFAMRSIGLFFRHYQCYLKWL